jgi:hypothetical protein
MQALADGHAAERPSVILEACLAVINDQDQCSTRRLAKKAFGE